MSKIARILKENYESNKKIQPLKKDTVGTEAGFSAYISAVDNMFNILYSCGYAANQVGSARPSLCAALEALDMDAKEIATIANTHILLALSRITGRYQQRLSAESKKKKAEMLDEMKNFAANSKKYQELENKLKIYMADEAEYEAATICQSNFNTFRKAFEAACGAYLAGQGLNFEKKYVTIEELTNNKIWRDFEKKVTRAGYSMARFQEYRENLDIKGAKAAFQKIKEEQDGGKGRKESVKGTSSEAVTTKTLEEPKTTKKNTTKKSTTKKNTTKKSSTKTTKTAEDTSAKTESTSAKKEEVAA